MEVSKQEESGFTLKMLWKQELPEGENTVTFNNEVIKFAAAKFLPKGLAPSSGKSGIFWP